VVVLDLPKKREERITQSGF